MAAVTCDRLIDGQSLDICGAGEQKRDHVYAEEMATANRTANRIAADIPFGALRRDDPALTLEDIERAVAEGASEE